MATNRVIVIRGVFGDAFLSRHHLLNNQFHSSFFNTSLYNCHHHLHFIAIFKKSFSCVRFSLFLNTKMWQHFKATVWYVHVINTSAWMEVLSSWTKKSVLLEHRYWSILSYPCKLSRSMNLIRFNKHLGSMWHFEALTQGVYFNWDPPKRLKYVKPRLGESTLT